MHNHQHNLKTHNMSKLSVIGLSIILITGISLVPALQIRVQGQVQQSPAPPSPGGSPSSGTPPPPSAVPRPPSPGGSPSSGTPPPAASVQSTRRHQEVVHHQELHHHQLWIQQMAAKQLIRQVGKVVVQSTKVLW